MNACFQATYDITLEQKRNVFHSVCDYTCSCVSWDDNGASKISVSDKIIKESAER